MKQIEIPTHCPNCDNPLEEVNDLLFCRNPNCTAQWDKKLKHFASTLKIKGLGTATIAKLDLFDYPELYELSAAEIQDRLGSEKLADKLYNEIQKSAKVDLQTLIPAFSIPLFGRSASQKLSKHISHVEQISEASCTEAGIGPKATSNLLNWLDSEFYPNDYITKLPFSFKSKKVVQREIVGIVCISGKLKSFRSKAEAQIVLEEHGFAVKPSLTKDCTHLINESGIESAKTKTARERGVTIINNLTTLI